MADQKEVIARLNEQIRKSLRANQDEFAASVTSNFDDVMGRACDDLDRFFQASFSGQGQLNYTDYKRLQMDVTELRMLKPFLDATRQATEARLEQALTEMYWDSYRMNAWLLDQTTPPNININSMQPLGSDLANDIYLQTYIRSQIMATWEGAMFSQRLGVITDKMARNIQTITDNAMVNGWSVPDLSLAIRQEVGISPDERLITRPRASAAKSRADMISRSEMSRASDLARENMFDQNKKLVNDEQWLASDLGNMCEECEDNDGQLLSDIGERPPLHPRCACSSVPVLKSWGELLGPEFAGMKDMGIDEYEMKYFKPGTSDLVSSTVQPYDEWLGEQ